MAFRNLVHKVTSFGTDELQENLDWDRDKARFITNPWIRAIYLLCFKISTYLYAFQIGYLGFTRQLDEVDIFGFVTKGRHLLLFLLVVGLASGIQLLKDHKFETSQDPKQRKRLDFILDCSRMVAYSLAYRFITVALIGKTKKMQLIYSGYILFALLIFFYLRKILFWSLFIGKDSPQDQKVWSKRKVKDQSEKDIENKIKQINFLMENLQKLKIQASKKRDEAEKTDE